VRIHLLQPLAYESRVRGRIWEAQRSCLVTDDGRPRVLPEGSCLGKDGTPLARSEFVAVTGGRRRLLTTPPTDLAAIRYRFAEPPEGDGAGEVILRDDAGQAAISPVRCSRWRLGRLDSQGGRLEHAALSG